MVKCGTEDIVPESPTVSELELSVTGLPFDVVTRSAMVCVAALIYFREFTRLPVANGRRAQLHHKRRNARRPRQEIKHSSSITKIPSMMQMRNRGWHDRQAPRT